MAEHTTEHESETIEPPCRAAGKYSVACPNCKRTLTLKWLTYGHVCGRTFDVERRAIEQSKLACDAVVNRLRLSEKVEQENISRKHVPPPHTNVSNPLANTQRKCENKKINKYSRLLADW